MSVERIRSVRLFSRRSSRLMMIDKNERIILHVSFCDRFTSTRCELLFLASSSVCSSARLRRESDIRALFNARCCVRQMPLLLWTVFQRWLRRITSTMLSCVLGEMNDNTPAAPSESQADLATKLPQDVSLEFACCHSAARTFAIVSSVYRGSAKSTRRRSLTHPDEKPLKVRLFLRLAQTPHSNGF